MKGIRNWLIVGLIIAGVFGGGIVIGKRTSGEKQVLGEKKDIYIEFLGEVWDKIKENYWETITDSDLSAVYLAGIDKLTNQAKSLRSQDKAGVEALTSEILKDVGEDKKVEFTATLTDLVLANLKPFGRSRLYAQKDETALSNIVNNVNPEENHLKTLGVNKGADDKEIARAFEEKTKEATTAAEKAKIEKAYGVLKESEARKTYEVSGVEPTIEYKLLTPEIFYMRWSKFSPTTLEEMQRVTAKVDSGNKLDSLILDLRDNIGGAIDGLPYFLGPFIGNDMYAYQFYHQGNKEDYKTKTGWMNSLVRYKKIVILVNEQSQSTAELMASVLKKYNVGVLVGTTTKGWGTVERVIPLEHQISSTEKYSMFLVHHVTLREDGQPIEGRGVDPVINIKSANWKKELLGYINNPELVKEIEGLYK